jgi:hypothetical protein
MSPAELPTQNKAESCLSSGIGPPVLELGAQCWNWVSYVKPQISTCPISAPVPKLDIPMSAHVLANKWPWCSCGLVRPNKYYQNVLDDVDSIWVLIELKERILTQNTGIISITKGICVPPESFKNSGLYVTPQYVVHPIKLGVLRP